MQNRTFKLVDQEYNKAVVTFGLQYFAGQSPYFSVTAAFYYHGREGLGGCCHKEIQEITGEYDDLIALHLATIDGVPMHALENGFYYLQKPGEFDDSVVENHFRIPLSEVPALRKLSKAELSAWIDERRPIWVKEARAAIQAHNLEH